jgi:hypothetical protein
MINAAIVHEDQLERFASGFHYDFQAVVELGDVLFFVMKGYDNRILEHGTSYYIVPQVEIVWYHILSDSCCRIDGVSPAQIDALQSLGAD